MRPQRSEPFRNPHLFAAIACFTRRYPVETLHLMYSRATLASKLLLWTVCVWHTHYIPILSQNHQ